MKHWARLAVVVILGVAADQASKAWAVGRLSMPGLSHAPVCGTAAGGRHAVWQRIPRGDTVVVVRDYLDFQYAENCGGAFSMFVHQSRALRSFVFLGISMLAVGFIAWMYRNSRESPATVRWALPLVLAGAIGNLLDRMRAGYVVDFIHAHIRERWHWPTFNVADIAISVGVGLLLLDYVLGRKTTVGAGEESARPAP